VKSGVENTDIDIVLLEGKTLYLFECKHSVPPTSSHEKRDVWEDIEKGTRQLRVALRVLADPARRLDYLTGWFPGMTREDAMAVRIVPCVFCSHRIFAGMQHDTIPIRDYASFAKLTGDGIMGIGVAEGEEFVFQRFRIVGERGFSVEDLDDYISADPKFFQTFKPFMHPVSRFVRCGGATIARKTYVFGMENDEWINHMSSLGFARLEDERRKWTRPLTGADLTKKPRPDGPPAREGEQE
jgi:hypothetical protein